MSISDISCLAMNLSTSTPPSGLLAGAQPLEDYMLVWDFPPALWATAAFYDEATAHCTPPDDDSPDVPQLKRYLNTVAKLALAAGVVLPVGAGLRVAFRNVDEADGILHLGRPDAERVLLVSAREFAVQEVAP